VVFSIFSFSCPSQKEDICRIYVIPYEVVGLYAIIESGQFLMIKSFSFEGNERGKVGCKFPKMIKDFSS